MKIEILYFDDCPSWKTGLENMRSALEFEGIQGNIILIKVMNDHDARRLKFLGSPDFGVDNQALWSEERENYLLNCRVYPTPDGIKGYPTVSMLRQQLQQLKGE
ncbi:MAG: thioredoxin family protein [Chloroflexota bacterium]